MIGSACPRGYRHEAETGVVLASTLPADGVASMATREDNELVAIRHWSLLPSVPRYEESGIRSAVAQVPPLPRPGLGVEVEAMTQEELTEALVAIGRSQVHAQIEKIRTATRDLYEAMQAGDAIRFVDVGCGQVQPWSEPQDRFVGIAIYRRPPVTP